MPRAKDRPALLAATRKGAFVLEAEAGRRRWTPRRPLYLGHIINHRVHPHIVQALSGG